MIRISRYTLTTLLLSLVFFTSVASATHYYDKRPQVLNTPANKQGESAEPPPAWRAASYGHFVLLAELVTFFPNSDFFMLARDIEYLHDIAEVIFKNNPELKSRIHLVPVSTDLSNDNENMVKYLEQEGLNKKALRGRTAVIIDSCCTGTIPTKIINAFGGKKVEIRGFLIQTSEYPDSKVANILGANGNDIEGLPHYTYSGTEFVHTSKGIRVKANIGSVTDRELSKAIIQQIRHDYDNAKARKDFAEIVQQMQIVHGYTVQKSPYQGSTKSQAVAALKILAEKYNIPGTVFLADIQNMERKGYEKIHSARVNEFRAAGGKIAAQDLETLTQKVLRSPGELEELQDKINGEISLTDAVMKALKLISLSTPKDLGMKQAQFNELVGQWLQVVNDNNYVDSSSPVTIEAFYRLNLKVLSPGETVKALTDYLGNIGFSDNDHKKAAKNIIVEAIAADTYRLAKGSALEAFLLDDSFLQDNIDIFKSVMNNVSHNASATELTRITDFLLVQAANIHNIYGDSDSAKIISSSLRSLVAAMPKISKTTVQALVDSDFVNIIDDPDVKSFRKWFFSQREKFESGALKIKVSNQEVKKLTGGKLQSGKSGLLVSDISNYFLPAGTKGAKCVSAVGR